MTSTASDTPKVSTGFDINAEFRSVMHELGLSPEDTGGEITFVGEDPIFPSVHRLGASIAIPIMAGAAGIADIWRQRTGRGQDLTLDLRKAIHGINPGYKFMPTVNGYPYQLPYWVGAPPMGFDLYRTKDGRLFLPTGAYPRMLEGMCTFLGCSPDKDSIAKAVSQWDSEELDKAAAEAGVVYAIVRTPEEWAVHPQGKYLADKPSVEIIKIGDSDAEPFTPAARPLSELRVLAATHVIAGNVMARTLAEHGAEARRSPTPRSPERGLMQATCAGFNSSAWLDLARPEGPRRAYELAAGADVFVENYRGHKMRTWRCRPRNWPRAAPASSTPPARPSATTGRGPTAVEWTWKHCASRGPPRRRHPGTAEVPPTKVMNDYIAGYIGAAGIQAALIRRAKEGGSYHVRVNLARCAMWFMSLGTVDKDAPVPTGEQHQLLAPDTITAQTPYGELVRLAPPVQFSETKPYWRDPVSWCAGQAAGMDNQLRLGDPRARWPTAGLARPTRPRGNEENDDYEIPSRGRHTTRLRADEHFTALVTAQGAKRDQSKQTPMLTRSASSRSGVRFTLAS